MRSGICIRGLRLFRLRHMIYDLHDALCDFQICRNEFIEPLYTGRLDMIVYTFVPGNYQV